MSRATDVAFPALTPHVLPADAPMAAWPGQLRIAVERLPLAAYVWDDDDPTIVWDGAGLVWDAPFIGEGFIDLLCDMTSAVIAHPPPDEHFLFPASAATVTIADPTGQYATVDADGRLIYWAPGRRCAIWWTADSGGDWWLFNGRIGSWRQDVDGSITIVAYCGFDELATEQGFDWYATISAQMKAPDLCKRVMAAVGYRNKTVHTAYTADDFQQAPAPPDSTGQPMFPMGIPIQPLASHDETTIPLDVMQLGALTETGALYCDVDDVIRFHWLDWREGRADQTTIPTFTDNVCEAGVHVVWDVELTNDDDWVATEVTATNQTGQSLRLATPTTGGWYEGVRYVYTPPGRLLFSDVPTAPDPGDRRIGMGWVMSYMLTTRADPRTAVEHCKLYLHDRRQDLWAFAIDRRRCDHLRFVSDRPAVGGPHRLDLPVCVVGMVHTITPDSWEADLYTTPAVAS